MKRKFYISALLALATCLGAQAQGRVVITAKLDSAHLLMGKTTALHIDLSQDKDVVGHFVGENSKIVTDYVEVASRTEPDTTDLGNNRIQISRDLVLQSFDSGMYVIPEQVYVAGTDTFRSNAVTLKVVPVIVDSMVTVHDFKPVEGVPFRLLDMLPSFIADYWWIYLIVIVLALAAVYVYLKWIRKGRIPLVPQPKPVPPYEEAISRLESLKQKQLWQSGHEKEYYTELTDILRNYIFRRFEINAIEMTSSQIIAVLRKNEETKAVNEQLGMILEVADFVKFAKLRPLADDNERSYNRALYFVNETKPVEAPPEDEEEDEDDEEGDRPAKPAGGAGAAREASAKPAKPKGLKIFGKTNKQDKKV